MSLENYILLVFNGLDTGWNSMVIGVWIYVSGYSRSLEIVFYWLMVTALQKKIDYRYLDMRVG